MKFKINPSNIYIKKSENLSPKGEVLHLASQHGNIEQTLPTWNH